MYNRLIYFPIAFLLFSLFFTMVTIFGFFIFTLIDRDYLNRKISLTLILKSFAIGLSLYLCCLMIIISFRFFNFFTAYLPFVIFDVVFLIYIFKKYDVVKNRLKNLNLNIIFKYLKRNKEYILILIIGFFMQYLLQLFLMDRSLPFHAKDPYYWFGETWFVHENGFLRASGAFRRPPGFILMCASCTSFIDDYYVFFFFMKYIPLFLMSINVLVIFVISKNIFKKKINIYFTIVILLSFELLISRNITPLLSNISTLFAFLLLLFLNRSIVSDIRSKDYKLIAYTKKKIMDKNLIFIGLLIAGIFMGHPYYWLTYLIFYLSYELLLLMVYLFQKKRFLKENLIFIFKFLITFFSLIFYILLFCIPTIICEIVYSTRGVGGFFSYLEYNFPSLKVNNLFGDNKIMCLITSLGEYLWELGYWLLYSTVNVFIDHFFKEFFFKIPFLKYFRRFYTYTIGVGIFFVVFGIFLKYRKNLKLNEKQNYKINFLRFTFIFLIIFIAIVKLMLLIKIPIVRNISDFFTKYDNRLYELFPGFWAIIFVLGVDYIFKLIKKLYFKFKESNGKPRKQVSDLFKISQIIIIILISGALYSTTFKRVANKKYFDDDAQVDALLFIGNYFNEHPLDEKTTMILEDLEEVGSNNVVYDLANCNNLSHEKHDFTTNNDYDDFKDHFDHYDSKYVLLPKYIFNEIDDFKEEFKEDFEYIYDNSDYIFAQIEK